MHEDGSEGRSWHEEGTIFEVTSVLNPEIKSYKKVTKQIVAAYTVVIPAHEQHEVAISLSRPLEFESVHVLRQAV